MSPRATGRLAALATLAALAALPGTASAVYSCGGESDTCSCGADNFCICCNFDGTSGNCVWYAWHMACCNWGDSLAWCTDASTWDGYAEDNGYPVRDEACESTIFV